MKHRRYPRVSVCECECGVCVTSYYYYLLLTTYRAEEVSVEHHDHRCDAVLFEHARLPVGGEAVRGHVGDDEYDADELRVLDRRVRLLVRVGGFGFGWGWGKDGVLN
jgi:hypothetical protein